jgi:hypothetical protein
MRISQNNTNVSFDIDAMVIRTPQMTIGSLDTNQNMIEIDSLKARRR